MKTEKQIQESTNSIMNSVKEAMNNGQKLGIFRWMSKDSHLNDVQKESRHELNSISRAKVENYVRHFDDYHMV